MVRGRDPFPKGLVFASLGSTGNCSSLNTSRSGFLATLRISLLDNSLNINKYPRRLVVST